MVKFNKLLIPPHNKGIYLEAEVLDMPYFKDVYIDSISIDTQDTFCNSGISKSPVYNKTIEGNIKSIKVFIDEAEIYSKIDKSLFFVYIRTKGIPSSDTPCGLDEPITLGVCADVYNIYRKGIQFIQEVYDTCEIPKNFIDFILRFKAFQMCLKTRDFLLAIKYWKMFNETNSFNVNIKCPCHG